MQQRHWLRRTPLDFPLTLSLGSAFVGLYLSYDRSLSWPLLATLVGSIAVYMVITRIGSGTTGLYLLTWVLLLVQSACALYFITQFNHLGYPVKMRFVSRLGQLTGGPFPRLGVFYPHPNAVATFIEGGLPLAAGLWLSARNQRERLMVSLTFLLLGYGLLLTVSRSAWLAVATWSGLSLAVWVGRRFARDRRSAGLKALIVLAAVVGAVVMFIGPKRMLNQALDLVLISGRPELYRNSLHLIRDYPVLGIGLGDTFGLIYSKYILLHSYPFLTYAHSLPLSVWLNQGLLGLISFGWMLIAFYYLVMRQAWQGQGTRLFWGAVLGATVVLQHGLTDAPQYSNDRWVMPVVFALMGLSVKAAPPLQAATMSLMSTARRKVLVAFLVIALGSAVVFLLMDVFYVNLGAIQHTRADLAPSLDDTTRRETLDQATRYYQKALELNAEQPMAHWRLGLIALNSDQFSEAIEHLEIGYAALPGHRGVQKAMGLAYLWDGQIDRAEVLLRPLHEFPEELDTWTWWRGEQGQDQLAEYAWQLRLRLSQDQR